MSCAHALWEKKTLKNGEQISRACVCEPEMTSKVCKPPLINQHCVVYKFSCDLCDTNYVRYTSRHLFQRIAEHKHSAIGKHLQEEHRLQPTNLQDQFTVLKKCRTKFDCLIYRMLFIRNIKPKLNTQSDSVRAKLFT